MLSKIKAVIHAYKIHDTDLGPAVVPATYQEDSQGAKSRVRRMFEAQESQMKARALVAHQCSKPDICTKSPCFIRQPDKIIGESIVEIPKNRITSLDMLKKD